MTDLKKTIELYRVFGIECKVNKDEKGFNIILSGNNIENSTCSEKFDGYLDFYSILFFDKKEKFIKQGFWE